MSLLYFKVSIESYLVSWDLSNFRFTPLFADPVILLELGPSLDCSAIAAKLDDLTIPPGSDLGPSLDFSAVDIIKV